MSTTSSLSSLSLSPARLRKLTTLPTTLRRLLHTLLALSAESIRLIIALSTLVWVCRTSRARYASEIARVRKNPEFHRVMREEMLPNWYVWLEGLGKGWERVRGWKEGVREWKSVLGSVGRAGMTPEKAVLVHQVELRRDKERWMKPPPFGFIRIHFFSSFDKGRYPSGSETFVAPNARLDVQLYEYWGADLREVKAALGIESIAFITDTTPFRTTFETTYDDRLSLLAAVELSKNFTRPIRIFVCPLSTPTAHIRTLSSTLHLLLSAFTLLFLALCGLPPRDPIQASLVHTSPFLGACSSLSLASRAAQGRIVHSVHLGVQSGVKAVKGVVGLVVGLLACALVLPLVLGSYALLGAEHGARLAVASAVKGVVLARSVPKEGWLVLVGVCWFVAAEYYSLRV
ncbi:unnamed protein product [Cyclocybe aegerita]|uniref:Uncharacterized protein n=1 Tax=Cyclocybe aegerita TaxID=1973307 RepID=A0A8S0WIK0_CYCAE|nr:unnamed protein product [Cyclocybe aegerita]